jgi:hypothetical protein
MPSAVGKQKAITTQKHASFVPGSSIQDLFSFEGNQLEANHSTGNRPKSEPGNHILTYSRTFIPIS